MEFVEALQLIDENKAFSKDVLSYFDSVDFTSAGLSYHLVSVFGSQSTGKSTLLNALFSTNFDVMNEAARRQTTKGIWMAKATLKGYGTSSPASSDSFLIWQEVLVAIVVVLLSAQHQIFWYWM